MLLTKLCRINRHLFCGGVILIVLCWLHVVCASNALATLLSPGGSALAAAEPDPNGGAIIASLIGIPFSTATFSGTLTSEVIQGDLNNPFGPGALTFTYSLTNNAVSTGEITRITMNSFAGFLADASYNPAGGLPPTLDTRSAAGDVIGFTFVGAPFGPGTMTPGSTSALLVVQTDAKSFASTFASLIGGPVTSAASLGPAVPEPSSFVLAVVGLAGLAVWGWRRRSH
jgi:hypothetical protein